MSTENNSSNPQQPQERMYQFIKSVPGQGDIPIRVPESQLTHEQNEILLAQMQMAFDYLPGIVQDQFAAMLIGRAAEETQQIEEALKDRLDENKYPGAFIKPKIILPEQINNEKVNGRPAGIIVDINGKNKNGRQ